LQAFGELQGVKNINQAPFCVIIQL
jgi:hypothetical protein